MRKEDPLVTEFTCFSSLIGKLGLKTGNRQGDYARRLARIGDLMRLTESQAEILAHCRVDADLSIGELAKRSGIGVNTARGALSRLKESGVIRRATLFDVSRLGFVQYDVMCSLASGGMKKRSELLAFLNKSPHVTFVLETGGEYQFVFTLCVSSPVVVNDFLQCLGDQFGELFAEIDFVVAVGLHLYGPKFLATKRKPGEKRSITAGTATESFDLLDRQLLKALSRSADESIRSLAASLGVPHSTVGDRLRSLREAGVLLGTFWSFNAQKIGCSEYRIGLSMKSLARCVHGKVLSFADSHPHVTYALECLGKFQICLGIVVQDAASASAVLNDINEAFGEQVAKATLLPVVGDRKVQLFPMFGESGDELLLSEAERPRAIAV